MPVKPLQLTSARQRGISWFGVLILLALAGGIWKLANSSSSASGEAVMSDPAAMNQLAKVTQASEVVMYTTSSCPYCHQAKAWFAQNLFLYTECNIDTSSTCKAVYKEAGMRGVPTLVVRGTQMRAGFNSLGFIELLSKKS